MCKKTYFHGPDLLLQHVAIMRSIQIVQYHLIKSKFNLKYHLIGIILRGMFTRLKTSCTQKEYAVLSVVNQNFVDYASVFLSSVQNSQKMASIWYIVVFKCILHAILSLISRKYKKCEPFWMECIFTIWPKLQNYSIV